MRRKATPSLTESLLASLPDIRTIIPLITLAVLFVSCKTPQRLAGRVHAGIYTSSGGQFSCPIPYTPEESPKIYDSTEHVYFSSRGLSLVRISFEDVRGDQDLVEALIRLGKEEVLRRMSRRYQENGPLRNFRIVTKLNDEFLPNVNTGSVFTTYSIAPSEYGNTTEGGLLVYAHGDHLFYVLVQLRDSYLFLFKDQSAVQRRAFLKKSVLLISERMKYDKPR